MYDVPNIGLSPPMFWNTQGIILGLKYEVPQETKYDYYLKLKEITVSKEMYG